MLTFIINPHSKSYSGIRIWKRLRRYMDRHAITYEHYMTRGHGHAESLARQLTTGDQHRILFILGGDGTVNEVLNGIQRFDLTTLAYIPTGSSNDFARSHNMSTVPLKRLKHLLKEPRSIYLDYGVLHHDSGNRRFMVSGGMGYDAAVCKEANQSSLKTLLNRLRLGKLIYVIIAIKQIFKASRYHGSLSIHSIPSTLLEKDDALVFASVHNHPYEGGGLKFCPDAMPTDGLLDCCIAKNASITTLLKALPKAYSGRHTDYSEITLTRSDSFDFHFDTPCPIHTDGEYLGDSNFVAFSVEKEGLHVLM